MRRHPIFPLIVGLSLCDCSDPPAPDPPDGTLAVSTSTSGDDPDPDGFHLRIDGSDPIALLPSGTAELDVSPGRHTLQLVGVAAHCSVTPGTSVDVDVTSGSTTPVAFQVSCPLTGARITVTTTGQDLDPDGYRVMVDGSDRGAIASNGTVLTRLDPGSRTVSLADLASNCAFSGPAVHTVAIVTAEIATIDFAVVCTVVPPPLTGLIWGHVLGEDSGMCIDRATVEIVAGPGTGRTSRQPYPPLCNPSSTEGWHFDSLPLGATVTLRATASGYLPKDSTIVVPDGGGPIQFVLQRATGGGVIAVPIHVSIQYTSSDWFVVALDGTTRLYVQPAQVGSLVGVPVGTHVVSISGPSAYTCSPETVTQTVTVNAGDTVGVTYTGTCVVSGFLSGFRLTTLTTGPTPPSEYYFEFCKDPYGGPCPSPYGAFGRVLSNDTLLIQLDPGTYYAGFSHPPSACRVTQKPRSPISFSGGVLDVEFWVEC